VRFLALSCAVLPLVSGIVLLLATAASRRGARLFAGLGLGIAVVVAALVFRQGRIELYGSFDSDPLSSFLVELLLVALAIPLARPSGAAASGRLILGGTLAILAVSTRDLLWATLLIVLFPFVVREEREESEIETSRVWIWVFAVVCLVGLAVVASVGGGTDLSALASSGLSVSGVGRGGLAVFATGLVLLWLAHSREGFRFSDENLVWCVSSSFLLLVAVAAVLLRLAAWIPEIALESSGSPGSGSPGRPHEVLRALVFGALVLGALGMLGSTRIRTFMTALAPARAGVVLAPLL
jgi:hypothetical protein